MTNEESWRVAWETVCARIDDLASCLHSVGASVPLTISELQDIEPGPWAPRRDPQALL